MSEIDTYSREAVAHFNGGHEPFVSFGDYEKLRAKYEQIKEPWDYQPTVEELQEAEKELAEIDEPEPYTEEQIDNMVNKILAREARDLRAENERLKGELHAMEQKVEGMNRELSSILNNSRDINANLEKIKHLLGVLEK